MIKWCGILLYSNKKLGKILNDLGKILMFYILLHINFTQIFFINNHEILKINNLFMLKKIILFNSFLIYIKNIVFHYEIM